MPLPNIKNQCTAKAKSTGNTCQNPAAYGCKTCRVHGARQEIISGTDHHWFKHGERSKAGMLTRREIHRRLALYEEIGHSMGFMRGKRTPGRKSQ